MTPRTIDTLTLAQVASRTPFSVKQLKQAIKATDPEAWPPPLRAKVTSRNGDGTPRQYVVREPDLIEWLDNLPDA